MVFAKEPAISHSTDVNLIINERNQKKKKYTHREKEAKRGESEKNELILRWKFKLRHKALVKDCDLRAHW